MGSHVHGAAGRVRMIHLSFDLNRESFWLRCLRRAPLDRTRQSNQYLEPQVFLRQAAYALRATGEVRGNCQSFGALYMPGYFVFRNLCAS
jgi:hypothetical protein